MAVEARIIQVDGLVFLELGTVPNGPRVASSPDDRFWPFDFYYDDEELARGHRVLVGIEALDVSHITDDWLAELDKLALPHVNVPEAGLFDVTISDVLRWARKTYPSRHARSST